MVSNCRVQSKKYHLLTIFYYICTTTFSDNESYAASCWSKDETHIIHSPAAWVLYWLSSVRFFWILHALACLMRTQFPGHFFFLFQNYHDPSLVLFAMRSFVLHLCHPESEHRCKCENCSWTCDISAIIGIVCVLLDNNFKVTYYGPAYDPILLHSLSSRMRSFDLV